MEDRKKLFALGGVALIALAAAAYFGTAGVREGGREQAAIDTSSFIGQMAMKTHGDASKLTPEERRKMDEITKNRTEETLRFHPAANMPARP